MQNEECAVQNECIFFENDFNKSAKPTPLFYILHSAFCIAQPKLRDKLKFELQKRYRAGGQQRSAQHRARIACGGIPAKKTGQTLRSTLIFLVAISR